MEVSFLRRVSFLASAPTDHLASLARRFLPRAYRKGQAIFHQGDGGSTFHIIEQGRVKIFLASEEGEEFVLAVLGPWDFFGELALIDGRPRSAAAVAMTDVHTYAVERRDFVEFLNATPGAAVALAAALAGRLRQVDERLAEIAFLDLHHRLARELLRLAEVNGPEIACSQRELGDSIGASRQRVNTVLGEWQRQGVLQQRRGGILLLDPSRLHHYLGEPLASSALP